MIEPCPICGSEVVFHKVIEVAQCKNYKCLYEGPIHDKGAEKHNRLSRIVRGAEEWAKAKRGMQSTEGDEHIQAEVEYLVASGDLSKAVDGGAE